MPAPTTCVKIDDLVPIAASAPIDIKMDRVKHAVVPDPLAGKDGVCSSLAIRPGCRPDSYHINGTFGTPWRHRKPPLHSQSAELVLLTAEIARIEGRIHRDEMDRIVAGLDQARVAGQVKDLLEAARQSGVRHRQFVAKGEFLWLVGMERPPIRWRGGDDAVTDPALICPGEIAEAAIWVTRHQVGIPLDDLPAATLHAIGFKRIGTQLAGCLARLGWNSPSRHAGSSPIRRFYDCSAGHGKLYPPLEQASKETMDRRSPESRRGILGWSFFTVRRPPTATFYWRLIQTLGISKHSCHALHQTAKEANELPGVLATGDRRRTPESAAPGSDDAGLGQDSRSQGGQRDS